MDDLNWQWRFNSDYQCLELYDADDRMLAWIVARPGYCDRGHFQVCLNESLGLSLDAADGRDLMYYMDLEAAMWETVEWLLWRILKQSHHRRGCGVLAAWVLENMPDGPLVIQSIKYRSTWTKVRDGQ